jgi:hypothetical protein
MADAAEASSQSPPQSPRIEPGMLVPQPRGGALRHGSKPGTNRGGSGRPPTAWKRACAAALRRAQALPVVERIISGDIKELLETTKAGQPIIGVTKNTDRLHAIEFLTEHAHGLPTQTVAQSNDITIRIVKE